MNKLTLFLSLLVICTSCTTKDKLKVNELTLTACNYIEDEGTSVREFYLASHIRIDSSGTCWIAKRNAFKQELRYYKAPLPDTLLKLINSMNFFKGDTSFRSEFTGMYCGFPYFITVTEKTGIKRRLASLIPPDLNGDYANLYNHLKKLCDTISYNEIDKFDYSNIVSLVQKDLMDTTHHKYPIKIEKLQNVQFLPPNKKVK